ncbi:MAG: Ig-like domain-containing protein, partial [Neisseria sp.]|nr:Ig-like domain-containing protein [Neisseria sp.]
VVDTGVPTAGTLSFSNLEDTGTSNNPAITTDKVFDLSMTASSDANGIASTIYQISTDKGVTWTDTTIAQSLSDDGTYQYRAIVTDNAGNTTTSNIITMVVDTGVPTAGTLSFSNLEDTGTSNNPAITTDKVFDLSMTASSDANGIASTIYQISTDKGVTWTDTTIAQSLSDDGTYQYRAIVTDNAGNTTTSNIITMVVDTGVPTVGTLSFSNLEDTGTSNNPAITTDKVFDLSMTASSDANGIASTIYQISTDKGVTWTDTTIAQSLSDDGTYQYRAIVTDNAGNTTTSNTITMVVDTKAPTAGTLSFSNWTDSGVLEDSISNDNTFDLTLTGESDANGIANTVYQFSKDGGAWTNTTINQSDLDDGTYQYRAIVTDNAGNTTASNTITMVLDNTAPTVTAGQVYSYAENQVAGTVVATATATDTVGVTGWQFTNGTQTTTDGYYTIDNNGRITITVAGVAAGVANNDYEIAPNSFNLSVQARDLAGNWSTATTVTLNVTNVNEAPTITTPSYKATYREGQDSTTVPVGNTQLAATDPEDGANVKFYFWNGTKTSTTSADEFFTIDPFTGKISLDSISSDANIYAKGSPIHELQVVAVDTENLRSAPITVTLTETQMPTYTLSYLRDTMSSTQGVTNSGTSNGSLLTSDQAERVVVTNYIDNVNLGDKPAIFFGGGNDILEVGAQYSIRLHSDIYGGTGNDTFILAGDLTSSSISSAADRASLYGEQGNDVMTLVNLTGGIILAGSGSDEIT